MLKKGNLAPTVLVILDGFGYTPKKEGNAIYRADMPNWKSWLKKYPNILLKASGEAVGLLPGFIGNSEVGHTTIGCGRIVKTTLAQIHESIKDGSFFKNEILIKNFEKLKKSGNALHILGLLSDAGVHSHDLHLQSIIKLAHMVGLKKIFIHPILDGRDTQPKTAEKYLENLQEICKKMGCNHIASLHGRFYAMDRDYNWDRIKKSYDVLCNKKNNNVRYSNWKEALDDFYKNKDSEEFFDPTLLIKDGQINKGDGVIFFNFRPDRARLLTKCFIDPDFKEFKTEPINSSKGTLSFFITPIRFDKNFEKFNNEVLFKKEEVKQTLLDEISEQTNNKVFVIAETEKYAHVTYFFRGLTDKRLPNEIYNLIPSIKTESFDKYPEMSAEKITDKVIESLKNDPAYFYLINYANPDMVGHSGNFDATVKACEFLDKQLKKLYDQVVEKMNGTLFIVSDHGNAEEMIYPKTNRVRTSHTTNPVIFLKISKKLENKEEMKHDYEKPNFGLSNVAPTVLQAMDLKVPKAMDGFIIF